MEQTAFTRWRKQVGLTQQEAADRLGVSKSQVANWDAGKDRATGKAVAPSEATRRLMTAIAMGIELPQPWPED